MSRRRITADDIIVSLGNIDEKWYDAALDMTPVRQTEQKRFVGYEMTKLLGVRSGASHRKHTDRVVYGGQNSGGG